MPAPLRCLSIAVAFCMLSTPTHTQMPDASDIAVAIDRDGDTFAVAVEFVVGSVSAPGLAEASTYAIGRDGQNARLAAKLTGFRIDIKPSDAEADVEAVP